MHQMRKRSTLKNHKQSISSGQPSLQELPFDENSIADNVIEICKKPFSQRRPNELLLLKNCLRSIKFFREQFDEHYEGMLEDVAANAKLHLFNKNEYVVKQDTYGDTFYILIKGQCRVVKRVVTHIGSQVDKKGKKKEKFHQQVKEIMVLNDGDYFGELALIEKKPRGADVICVVDSYCLSLDKDSFDRIMSTKTKRQFLHLLEILSNNSILREISKNTVKALFMIMERKVYNFGDIVFRQGQKGSSLYFIIDGVFKMYSDVEFNVEQEEGENPESIKKQAQICVLSINETMGLEEFMNEEPRKWKAECQSQVGVVYKLDRVDYKRIENRYPDIVEAIQNIRDEKKNYYDNWKQIHTIQPITLSNQESNTQNKFNFSSYSHNKQQLKQIILKDSEMSFISRDQVTINDDQEIMLKYSKFCQLGPKPATPFQINTIQQIQSGRIKSAGYRPVISKSIMETQVIRPTTAKLNTDVSIKKIQLETSPSMIQLLTTQTPMDGDGIKSPISPARKFLSQSSPSNKKSRNHTDIVQSKMMVFMQLSPEKIEKMAIQQRLDKEEYKAKKLYIKKYPIRSVESLISRVQSAVKLSETQKANRYASKATFQRKPMKSMGSLIPCMHVQLVDGERIHAGKKAPPRPIDTSVLPLKYQSEFFSKTRKITVVSPISTFMKLQRQSTM